MSKTPPPEKPEDFALFRSEFSDVKPVTQDKVLFRRNNSKQKSSLAEQKRQAQRESRQVHASFEFSDEFRAHFDSTQPLKYVKAGEDSGEVKRLRRGDYPPDLVLDLHGFKKDQAKLEIAALIHIAQKQHAHCICIVHGIGEYILKQSVPSWLVQHPAVLGFHQAPLEWGGQGALLVLIDIQN